MPTPYGLSPTVPRKLVVQHVQLPAQVGKIQLTHQEVVSINAAGLPSLSLGIWLRTFGLYLVAMSFLHARHAETYLLRCHPS